MNRIIKVASPRDRSMDIVLMVTNYNNEFEVVAAKAASAYWEPDDSGIIPAERNTFENYIVEALKESGYCCAPAPWICIED